MAGKYKGLLGAANTGLRITAPASCAARSAWPPAFVVGYFSLSMSMGSLIRLWGALRLRDDVPELASPLFDRDKSVHGLFADTVGPGHEIGVTVGRTMDPVAGGVNGQSPMVRFSSLFIIGTNVASSLWVAHIKRGCALSGYDR